MKELYLGETFKRICTSERLSDGFAGQRDFLKNLRVSDFLNDSNIRVTF